MFSITTKKRLSRLFKIMLPILATQLCFIDMAFLDASMSGHAGPEQIAGTAIGANMVTPFLAATMGFLMAVTPIIAQLVGKQQLKNIGLVIRTELVLALIIGFSLIISYFYFFDHLIGLLHVEPKVVYIAKFYVLYFIIGANFAFLTFPLRSLCDTVVGTKPGMIIYLLALPIDAMLNYMLIFGHFGFPKLGGIGAGIATSISLFIILILFLIYVSKENKLKDIQIFKWEFKIKNFIENIKLGIPIGLGNLMEMGVFGLIVMFISKFGTDYIASHQAANNFASLIYMFPLSFSIALTIIIGIEVGAKNYKEAKAFSHLAIKVAIITALGLDILIYFGSQYVILIYTTDSIVAFYMKDFLIYTMAWQLFDAVACPTQGILRGYKDVNIPFIIVVISYWIICLPLGLYLDYFMKAGAISYWQSLVIGIFVSAIFMGWRLYRIERRY